MIIPQDDAHVRAVLDADQTEVPFDFAIRAAADLKVSYLAVDAEEWEDWTIGSDFALADWEANSEGGTLEILIDPLDPRVISTGDILVMWNDPAIERLSDFGRSVTAASLNNEFSKIYLIMQRLRDRGLRSPRMDDRDLIPENFSFPPLTSLAGKVMSFDANGRPEAVLERTAVEGAYDAVNSIADALAAQYILGIAAPGGIPNGRVLTDTATVAFDLATAGEAKANVPDRAITNAKLRASSALSVIGRSFSTSGGVADILAGANDRILRRVGNALDFGQLTSGMFPSGLTAADFAHTGTPTAPTAAPGTNTTQLANTAFVQAAVAALVGASPETLNALNELAAAIGNDPNFATTMATALGNKQPLDADLTAIAAVATQAYGRALLSLADLPALKTLIGLFSGTSSGLVPSVGGAIGTTRFLREDGTFAVPPGTGGGGGASSLSLRPEDYGAIGDGVADDTAAMQACFNALGIGGSIELKPFAVYLVDELILKTKSSDWRYNRVFCAGTATIKKRASANTSYLIVTDRWLSTDANKIYPGNPYRWEGIIFDGDLKCDHVFIAKQYGPEWDRCQFYKWLQTGLLFTRKNQDGTLGTTGYNSGLRLRGTYFTGGTGGQPFRNEGTATDDTDASTDGHIIDCQIDGTGSQYCILMGNTAGWLTYGNHFWGGSIADVRIKRYPEGFTDNIVEGLVIVDATGWHAAGVIGPGNSLCLGVAVNFTNDATVERIAIVGNFISQQPGTGTRGLITHNMNRAEKTIFSDNVSLEDDVHVLGAGNTLGRFEIGNLRAGDLSGSFAKMYFDRLLTTLFVHSDILATAASGFRQVRARSGTHQVYIGCDGSWAYIGNSGANLPIQFQQNGVEFMRKDSNGLSFHGVTPVARPLMAAATGTKTRTTFATGSVTTAQLAERVAALIDDLRAYGLHA